MASAFWSRVVPALAYLLCVAGTAGAQGRAGVPAPAAEAASASATAWPQFRGSAQLTGVAPAPLPATLKVLWSYEAEELIEASAAIVDGIERGAPVVYAPAKWALIMMVIRHLPRFIFNKMDI